MAALLEKKPDLTVKQLAAELGMKPNTVSVYLARLRK